VTANSSTSYTATFTPANRPPTAVATATPDNGPAPLTVQLDGSGSSDPDAGDSLSYAWDLDGDGQYDDSTAVAPSRTFTSQGVHTASLRVTDSHDASSTAAVTISVGNSAPTATINTPAPGTTWKVGDLIEFAGGATDAQDGPLPASALSWSLILHHCPSNCHTHPLQSFDGVAGGSFTTPDHEYPSHLELRLTARDSGGLTDTRSVQLDRETPSPLAPLASPLLPPDSDAGGVPVTSAPRRLRFRAYVAGVIDGDTIKVRRGVRRYTVRLIGIDAPETRKPGTSVECGGREATSRMFSLGFTRPRDRNRDGLYDRRGGNGRRVRVRTDPTQPRGDRDGRLLAYVASARGSFATAQLRAGWASVYVSGKPFARLASFQAAEASAREDSRGIWARCRGNTHTPAVR
jgi:endonuclease YncB( thermonuclease family)/PKD repeat protein